MSDLDARLLAAHAQDDRAALVELYRDAALAARAPGAEAFFLTQAYVFALDTGHADTGSLHARLVALGRDS